jgi:hypothetical protein
MHLKLLLPLTYGVLHKSDKHRRRLPASPGDFIANGVTRSTTSSTEQQAAITP